MKRIQLFEFEDFPWFPNWLRKCLTRMMVVMHKILNTSEEMAELVSVALKQTENNNIIDLCSGSGGPMLDVLEILKEKYQVQDEVSHRSNLPYFSVRNSQEAPEFVCGYYRVQ